MFRGLNPYGYTGRELDTPELYYYRARYYDPQIQRFLGEDPIGFASGNFNWHRYVWNSPVNKNDPTGMIPTGSWEEAPHFTDIGFNVKDYEPQVGIRLIPPGVAYYYVTLTFYASASALMKCMDKDECGNEKKWYMKVSASANIDHRFNIVHAVGPWQWSAIYYAYQAVRYSLKGAYYSQKAKAETLEKIYRYSPTILCQGGGR